MQLTFSLLRNINTTFPLEKRLLKSFCWNWKTTALVDHFTNDNSFDKKRFSKVKSRWKSEVEVENRDRNRNRSQVKNEVEIEIEVEVENRSRSRNRSRKPKSKSKSKSTKKRSRSRSRSQESKSKSKSKLSFVFEVETEVDFEVVLLNRSRLRSHIWGSLDCWYQMRQILKAIRLPQNIKDSSSMLFLRLRLKIYFCFLKGKQSHKKTRNKEKEAPNSPPNNAKSRAVKNKITHRMFP